MLGTKKHKRYVTHFDMLGFKTAILRNQDESWGALSDLRKSMDKMLGSGIGFLSADQKFEDRIRAFIFSDSILIFTLRDDIEDLISIIFLTGQLFADALAACIPLRGGIAYGDFYYNTDLSLYCGIPFVRAYEIGESAQWSGIVIDDLVAQHYHTKRHQLPIDPSSEHAVIQWDVPVKPSGNRKHWVFNWPVVFRRNFKIRPPISPQQYYEAFKSLFGPYENLADGVKSKYENTVHFLNETLKRYDE